MGSCSNRFWTLKQALWLALLLAALGTGPASASDNAQITSFELDNGLEVVVIPDHRAPVVTHMLWYKVGSADEELGKSGIAHFFEHLMFKGTANHPAGEFSARVAEIGGEENAFTSSDYTAYYQRVAPEALADMMAFEADRMRNLVLTDEVIKPERDVVLEERRSRIDNNPGSILAEELDATLYQNSPYGIPVIGWKREIEQLNRKDAIAFYDRYYAPNNAILIVAGDVDAAEVRKLAAETYGKISANDGLPPRIRPQEPEQNTMRTVTLRDPRVTVPSVRKLWVVPSYNTDTNGEAEALDLLSEVLGGGTRSRLYQELVVKRGIADSTYSYYLGTSYDDTAFGISGRPRGKATLAEVEAAIDAEIVKIAEKGISDAELTKAKNRFIKSIIFARDSQTSMARLYGSTLATGGSVEDILQWPDRIRSVTPEAVQSVAKKYLDLDRSTAGYLLPSEDGRS